MRGIYNNVGVVFTGSVAFPWDDAPLGVEGHHVVQHVGKVVHVLLVGVGIAAAVGSGVPSVKGVTRALKVVSGKVLGLAIGEIHILHRACDVDAVGGVGVEMHGVGVDNSGSTHRGVGRGHGEAPHAFHGVDGGSRAACRGVARAGDSITLGGVQRHHFVRRSEALSGGGAGHGEVVRQRDAVGRLQGLGRHRIEGSGEIVAGIGAAIKMTFTVGERLPGFHGEGRAVITAGGDAVGGGGIAESNGIASGIDAFDATRSTNNTAVNSQVMRTETRTI